MNCCNRLPRQLLLLPLLWFAAVSIGSAQNTEPNIKPTPYMKEMERKRYEAMEKRCGRICVERDRASRMEPRPRSMPLRYLNISDLEVSEVEAAVWAVYPNVLVHIGPVVTGCPCEDGPGCQDQVWVLVESKPVAKGLQVSRIADQWTLGPAQRWWLEYAKVLDELRTSRDVFSLVTERRTLERMPVCADDEHGA